MEFRVVCDCRGTCRASQGRGRRSDRVLSAASSVAPQRGCGDKCRPIFYKINLYIVLDDGYPWSDTVIQQAEVGSPVTKCVKSVRKHQKCPVYIPLQGQLKAKEQGIKWSTESLFQWHKSSLNRTFFPASVHNCKPCATSLPAHELSFCTSWLPCSIQETPCLSAQPLF